MQHNGLSAASNSSTLIEELGSVTHVFSDKTGTLTDNLMIFTSAYVMGSGAADSPLLGRYHPTDGIPPNPERHVSGQFDTRAFERVVLEDGEPQDTPLLFLLGLCLCHSVLIKDSIEPSDDPLKRLGSEFLYDASSPDELALVAGARHLGFEFTARPTPDTIRINLTTPFARKVIQGRCEREDTSIDVELLEVIEFDNDRKRMSVLVKIMLPLAEEDESQCSTTTTRILLLIKDAASPEEELESVLDVLSAGGLRTLVYGVRDLTSDMPFVESWRRSYNGARGLVGVAKERALKQCIEEMKCDIDIVGCTGIEDKLQDYVPDTIADLHEAGMKVWVLTGDKIETAINIAYSSRLLGSTVLNEVITATTPSSIHKTLDTLSHRIIALSSSTAGRPSAGHQHQHQHGDRSSLATLEWDDLAEVKLAKRGLLSVSSIEMDADPPKASALPLSGHGRGEEAEKEPTTSLTDVGDEQLESEEEGAVIEMNRPTISSPSSWTSVAITISGDSLAVVLKDRPLRKKFFKFTLSHCITVIACRVSPKQKAQIVRWSGSYLPANTMLAIGDGANDVGMIVSADVGVGINGKEGAQAARSADYAIPQFHFLRRLLFLHGRESIRKNSTFIYYTVFKNIAFSLPAFLLGFVSQFSGTSLYDPILKQGYNVIFTLLPILLYGIFDRQLPTNITSSCPYLYLWPGISLKRLCRMECTSRKLIRLKFSPFNLFGNKHLLLWLLAAVWVSICSTAPSMIYLYNTSIDSNGNSSPSLAGVGSLIFLHIIILCNFVVYMLSNIRYWFTHIGIIGGIIAYLLAWIMLTEVSSSSAEGGLTTSCMLFSPSTGAVLLSGLGIAFLPFVLYHQYKPLFSPGNAHLVEERLSLGLPVQLSELYSALDDHEGPRHPKDLESSSTAHLSHNQQHHLASPPLSHPRHVTTIGAGPVPSRVLDGDIGPRRAATLASRGFGFDEVSRIDRIGKYRSVDTISLAGSSPVSRYHQRHTVDWSDGRRDDTSATGQPLQRDRWQTRRSISGCSDGGDSSSS
ncbi:hypothetical protein FOZ62_012187 [Perkinsus olseni]|uniref:P-type ATPase C-terminal domain-containing protein n=1 Tax=Perkinsus olseni TaxID=32597 RepID=A0A7J6SLL5_PEROL|nr:hypothetical protein FOZ62_012187 [Perkinsus olseni]